jgi:hypothetical protein
MPLACRTLEQTGWASRAAALPCSISLKHHFKNKISLKQSANSLQQSSLLQTMANL